MRKYFCFKILCYLKHPSALDYHIFLLFHYQMTIAITFEANIRIEIRKYRLYSSLPPFLSTCVCISNTKQLPIRFVRLLEPQPFTPRPPAARLRSCSSHVRLLLRRSSHGISGEFLCSRVRRAAVRIVCGCARFLPRISRGVRVCVRARHVRVCMCAGWRSNNSWIC